MKTLITKYQRYEFSALLQAKHGKFCVLLYYCPLKVKKRKKIRADSIKGFSPFRLFLYLQNNQITMSKNSIFFGQPIYGQLIKSLDRDKIVEINRKHVRVLLN